MESKSGVCTKNTYVKSAKNRGEILVPGVSKIYSFFKTLPFSDHANDRSSCHRDNKSGLRGDQPVSSYLRYAEITFNSTRS